jgi:hypothetical protein
MALQAATDTPAAKFGGLLPSSPAVMASRHELDASRR